MKGKKEEKEERERGVERGGIPNVSNIGENESFGDVKTNGNDVFHVFAKVFVCVLQGDIFP